MTIIHRQFRLLNNRPANLRRPLLFAPTVMTCSNLRQSFPCFVRQSSALKVRLLSFSIFFQYLSCWSVLRPALCSLFSRIDLIWLSSIQLLVFSFWKDLQPEFPTFSQFRFSCVPMLSPLCRQVAFAFPLIVISLFHAPLNWTSTLCQEKTRSLRKFLTWNIQVSKRDNHILLLAWFILINNKIQFVGNKYCVNRLFVQSFQCFIFCFKLQIDKITIMIKHFHRVSFVSSSFFFLLDYVVTYFTPSVMLSNNTNGHFHCWISVPNSVNYFFFAFHDYFKISKSQSQTIAHAGKRSTRIRRIVSIFSILLSNSSIIFSSSFLFSSIVFSSISCEYIGSSWICLFIICINHMINRLSITSICLFHIGDKRNFLIFLKHCHSYNWKTIYSRIRPNCVFLSWNIFFTARNKHRRQMLFPRS